ncbi:carboxypeptidase regulatory-like domain-containing protein [Diaphorobacter sp. HDW4A]|uniref:carboxypeptidase-like regulatory domain-containing protein n=1 Tax=Diaphorobacter sp. HDW4A TaxID=2714924 RepID=UPI00140732A9|nr:carboxypeptidase-like regulatory domain-containing protein [Diaphorobacter sp. HDW4A]QIL81791.1 carboxypeptidase regulatory-like domain-containing protein [Diaphorobacter sp. HDW4A]
MKAWLQIDGGVDGCSVGFVRERADAALLSTDRALPLLAGISTIQRPLSIPGIASASTSNMDADLDNAGGELTKLWGTRPPVRHSAQVLTVDGSVFEGIVTTIQLGSTAKVSLEAGMDRPISDNVPLRTSAVWGGWREVLVLPWGWGQVTVTPIQYSDDQRLFFLLDHPIAGVDEVKRDDVATMAFDWRNGVDSTGQAVSFLELAEPLADGERLAVTLRGRMHPVTGLLLQTPAEILHDVLANLARAPVEWADFDDYRTETSHLVLGGLMADNSVSIRAAIDELMQSAGSAWAAAMPGIAMTWPPIADDATPAMRVDKLNAEDLQATTQATGICTVLRVLYDWDHAGSRFRRAIQLQAPDAVNEYGVLEQEWKAPWLRTARHAEQLGQRMLAWLARPRWRVTWQQSFADVATGAWVHLNHPLSPIEGRHRLVSAELDLSAASLSCTVEAPIGSSPVIETTQLSSAFDPVIQAGITVEIADSEIIFTARDEQGHVLAGARITLNGQSTRIADSAGRVSFPVQRGRHVLLIEADGYPASEAVVVV